MNNNGKDKLLNRMKLEFLNRSENESFARVAVAAFASPLDPTVEELTKSRPLCPSGQQRSHTCLSRR
jgi:hypothetical protein